MTWTEILESRRNKIVIAFAGLGIAMAALAYAPGLVWRTAAWILFGATAIVVLAVLGQMLYAIVSVETGYRSVAAGEGSHVARGEDTAEAEPQPRIAPQPFATGGHGLMPKVRAVQFDEAVADLRAAQYLLSKVQNSTAFREFSERQKHECDHALEEVRALLGEVTRDTAVQRFAS